MLRFSTLCAVLGFAFGSVQRSRYDGHGSEMDRGYEAMNKLRNFEELVNGAYGNSEEWNRLNNRADDAFERGNLWSQGIHDSGARHRAAGSHSDSGMSDFGREVKKKTYGFFNYKYVKPQYHIEQFHSDEKHTNRHSSDSHNSGTQQSSNGGYHNRGHEHYARDHNTHRSKKGSHCRGEHGRGFKESDYEKSYGHHDGSDFHRGHDDHGAHFHSRDTGRSEQQTQLGKYTGYNSHHPRDMN